MTVTVANVANTNTFDFWKNRTNELADAMTNKVVTVNTAATTGNAEITGTFTANVLAGNTVYLSNTTSNLTISIPNTSVIASGDYFLNANGEWNAIVSPVTTLSVNTSGISSQQIDNYAMADFGGVEFFIRVKDQTPPNANSYQAVKILTFHNGVTAFSTEYGSMISNAALGTFSVSTNTTHVILSMTPTLANNNLTISRVNF